LGETEVWGNVEYMVEDIKREVGKMANLLRKLPLQSLEDAN